MKWLAASLRGFATPRLEIAVPKNLSHYFVMHRAYANILDGGINY